MSEKDEEMKTAADDEHEDEAGQEETGDTGDEQENELSAEAREFEEDPSRNPQDEMLKDIKGG